VVDNPPLASGSSRFFPLGPISSPTGHRWWRVLVLLVFFFLFDFSFQASVNPLPRSGCMIAARQSPFPVDSYHPCLALLAIPPVLVASPVPPPPSFSLPSFPLGPKTLVNPASGRDIKVQIFCCGHLFRWLKHLTTPERRPPVPSPPIFIGVVLFGADP